MRATRSRVASDRAVAQVRHSPGRARRRPAVPSPGSRPSTRCSPPAPAIVEVPISSTLKDGLFDARRRLQDVAVTSCEIFSAAIGGTTIRPARTPRRTRTRRHVRHERPRPLGDPADDKRCIGWARDFFNASAPFASGGVYVNFLTADEAIACAPPMARTTIASPR